MAVSMFLKLEGKEVKGESVVQGHKDEIDVHSWAWGMHQSGSMHHGTGGGSGKVNVQDIHIHKMVDKASPVLIGHCCSGQHFDKATLIIEKAGGDKHVPYLKIEMEGVIISGYNTGGHGGDDRIKESLTLNFAKYKVVYTPQSAKGTAEAEITQSFNIAENRLV